jgi:hypothetical protein
MTVGIETEAVIVSNRSEPSTWRLRLSEYQAPAGETPHTEVQATELSRRLQCWADNTYPMGPRLALCG